VTVGLPIAVGEHARIRGDVKKAGFGDGKGG
jgi:hypothetical protein